MKGKNRTTCEPTCDFLFIAYKENGVNMKIYITSNHVKKTEELEFNGDLTPQRRKRIKQLFSHAFAEFWKCPVNITFEDEHFLYNYPEAEKVL